MNLEYDQEERAFRDEVRQFLREKLPDDIRAKAGHFDKEDHVRWYRILNERGWAAPAWPAEYGGPGWNAVQRHIFEEESAMADAPPKIPFGFSMVAPVIMNFGSQAQKDYFLPRILNAEDWWCQGYSEPGAGSDLASLKTSAARDGDHYVVNGQKTWTTLGQWADWIFCLVRTDSGGRKQEGISFLLVDMQTPGVTVRPIITIDGAHEVNEVFFDNVRVPVDNLVGEEGKGWTIAKFLLGYERTGNARIGGCKRELQRLKDIAAQETLSDGTALADDPLFSARVAETEIELTALEATNLRALAAARAGAATGAMPSMLKIRGSEIQQWLSQLEMEAAGPYALPYQRGAQDPVGPAYAADATPHYLNNRKTSIYAGSNEIQHNIIAKMMLS
jgi:alkylation response protein AidB-like acyl-CoA dehydrogenase